MGSGIAKHKPLYEGPVFHHGQDTRTRLLHVKGKGHAPSKHSTVKTKSPDRFLSKRNFQRKARRVLLQP